MKKFTLLCGFLFLGFSLFAQNLITVKDADLSGDTRWTANNTYLLDGFVYLETGTLTIDPGTVIKGKATPSTGDNASALIITRDAKIMAEGTAQLPIIFTAEDDDLSDPADLTHEDRGLWGGVIILGKGVIGFTAAESAIEGIPAGETRAVFGGNDDTHNSGVFKYVSIRHGGAELSPGNEINGLSLAGAGSQTVIENVEVFANSDDGFEFWGGTVMTKYLIAAFCGDDAFDYDDGWRGGGQFWFAIQGNDAAGSAGEHDGAHPDDNPRFAKPTIYNATYIGPGKNAGVGDVALMLRDGAGGIYANSIFTDFSFKAIEVEDRAAATGTDSRKHMENGDLVFKNNIWYNFGAGDELVAGKMIQVTADAEDPTAAFLISHLTTNANSIENPVLSGISRNADGKLDPRPHPASPAFSNVFNPAQPIAGISTTTFRGAFGSENWAKLWSALDQMGYFGELYVSTTSLYTNEFVLKQNYPNPFTGTTTIEYYLPEPAEVNLSLYDITGKLIKTVVHENQWEGTHQVSVSGLQKGIYFCRLSAGNNQATNKMIVK